ncbi:DNA topoisomerase I [Archaeoglobales archaeon ex4484_92]|nr:MAG: DNA topoisomerase I [Archaeoglobales archaeon ex4484_92]
MVMSWLIIAEKDVAARRIANFLFGDVQTKKDGSKYYYSKSNDAYVVGLRGHIVELDFPKELSNWNVPLSKLLNSNIKKEFKERGVISLLRKLAPKIGRVTIATDYDREGELIGVEALEIVLERNPNVKVDRVRYSSITRREILNAFSKPSEVDYNLANAALARHKVDLIWGAVLTRLVSTRAKRVGKNFLSVGRVQTPTLRIIVEREEEIKNFKPKKFFEVVLEFGNFEVKYSKKFYRREDAEELISKIGNEGRVVSFESKFASEGRPTPFNTTEFLREASKFISPDKAMKIAENLYLEGYISYPRTDNTVYPKSIDLIEIVRGFINSDFSKEALIVLQQDKIIPSAGKRVSKDHPPLHPTSIATKKDLNRMEWKIYELIVRRFLSTLAPKSVWEVRKLEIDCNGIKFRISGRKLVKAGWREIYIYSPIKELHIPKLSVGSILKIVKKRVDERETKPPRRYSHSTIIKLMEKLNLGTKSTRHEILRKLFDRSYVTGNPLVPTQIAFSVINALKKCAEIITLPDMTSKLESDMDLIAEGRKSESEVVEESRRILSDILRNINYDEFSKELNTKNSVGICPICGGELVIKRYKKRFIGCTNYPDCKFSIPLPQRGAIHITGKVCKVHKMNEIKIKSKKGTWDVGCPYCNYLRWVESK